MAEYKTHEWGSVREICQRLKPILGQKVEGIYQAYLAEDAEGQRQIERYLDLLAARHLPAGLDQASIDLLPPDKDAAAGAYPVGLVEYAGKELYPFGLREEEWIQHMAILGRSGAGKTNTGFIILDELNRQGKPFLLFDWKRNYRDLLSLPQFQHIEVYTIGRNIAPFRFNPLIPPQGTDPKIWLKKLNEVIAHAYCLGNGVLFLLQQAVDAVYEDAGVYDGTVEKFPTFKEVMVKARNMDTRGRESGWLSSTLRALSSLCFGEMDRLLNTNNNQSIDHIMDKSVILELDSMTQSDKTFFIEAAMLYIHHKRMAEPQREQFRHVTVIEEAHHVLASQRTALTGGESVMDIIFREIREFGESLVLLDQHPSRLSLPSLSNTYTTICHNLKHKTEINAMGQNLLLDKERDLLSTLPVGHAVVKIQGRIPHAFQVKIPKFEIQKGVIADNHVRRHMQTIAPAEALVDFRLPPEKPPLSPPVNEGTSASFDSSLLALLHDIQEYPDSGIAQRYHRLGVSVRQGQKLKAQLLDKQMATEELQATSTGRLRRLLLTEKGQRQITGDLF